MSARGEKGPRVEEKTGSEFLFGRYDYSLDPKKRITLPSPWRHALGNPSFVYVMPDGKSRCLNIIPAAEMEARLSKLRERALFDPGLARALHVIGANSEQLALDVQGRIRISDRLLQFANLSSKVAMVGAVRKIEIWNPAVLVPADAIDLESHAKALEEVGF